MTRDKNTLNVVLTCSVLVLLLSGCPKKQPDMYYWGEYETLIYRMYVETESANADVQIEKIIEDIKAAQKEGGKTPPGVYAHLGFMYAISGKGDLAIDAFTEEKTLFPESAKFIDGMMARAVKGGRS